MAYRPAVITFLDVLGFSALVGTRPAEEIARIVSLTRRFAQPDEDHDDDEGEGEHRIERTRSFAFSDSVVRVRAYDTDASMGALFHEVIDLVHAQADLANRGVLVRGGLTVGEVHAEGDVVFGPGFNRAYGLEHDTAVHPRIVIGPEVLAALRADPRLRAEHHDLGDETAYLRDLLRRGDDGLWFVDYLRAIEREMDEPDTYPDFLAHHRALILQGAEGAPPRVLHKHLWLARYHNAVVRRRYPDGMRRLRITRRSLPQLDDLRAADEPQSGTDARNARRPRREI